MKYIYTLIIVLIIVLIIGVGAYSLLKPTAKFGTTDIPINRPMTSTGVLCNTTSTLLVATSTTGRNFATITNIGGTIVYLGFGNSAALYTGTALAINGGTIKLDSTASYTGAIYCISPTAASTTVSDSNS